MTEVLRMEGVDFVRGSRQILTDINLTVRAGERWTLIGPNGAGKSTILSICGAEKHPTRGTVHVLEQQLGRVEIRRLRESIGHVNPRHPVRSALTPRQVVLTGATGTAEFMPHWEPDPKVLARADPLIDMLGIDELDGATWPTMSQGERGRPLIARALVTDPTLLLLDGPGRGSTRAVPRDSRSSPPLPAEAGHGPGHPSPRGASREHHACGAHQGRGRARRRADSRGAHHRAGDRKLRLPHPHRAPGRAVGSSRQQSARTPLTLGAPTCGIRSRIIRPSPRGLLASRCGNRHESLRDGRPPVPAPAPARFAPVVPRRPLVVKKRTVWPRIMNRLSTGRGKGACVDRALTLPPRATRLDGP